MPLFHSESITVDHEPDGAFALTLDVPGKSLNVLTRQVLADLDAALDVLATQPRLPVLIVKSGKKSGFLAGADMAGFLEIRDDAGARALSEQGQKLFNKLAALPGPSIAAIHGPCLGGGLELALACDYRLVVDRPNTQLGLPEVELGLLPGWGGTQRLPRTVGLERALQMILGRKRLDAREARAWALADALAANEDELRQQTAWLIGQALAHGKRSRARLPLNTWRQTFLESTGLGRRVLFRAAERRLHQRVPDDMPAPAEALEAVRVGLEQGVTTGLTQEREAAGRLATSTACRNLVSLFFQVERARKGADERGAAPRKVGTVAVVGAGVMGAGIAQLLALKGAESVLVQEVSPEALTAGLARIDELFAKALARRLVSTEEAARRRAIIRGTVGFEGFDRADVVIEAAVEELALKKGLFRELEARSRPDTVLATNTSSLRVADLQADLRHPGRVVGMHFFNPVHKMPLVEVVRGPGSTASAVERVAQLAADLGKTPVTVGDGPGFVVNRVLMPYLNEAVILVSEGLTIAEVDRVMTRFGMPMGPLELLDQIGLDVAAHVARALEPVFADRFPPNPGFAKLREKGWLGAKSGVGFYRHKGKKPRPNDEVQALLRGQPGPLSALPPAARLAEARERLVLPMVNEAARVLQEKVADEAATVDLALVLGTGWAPHRGGPLRYADDRGLGDVVQALNALANRCGPRFLPCDELTRRGLREEKFRPEEIVS